MRFRRIFNVALVSGLLAVVVVPCAAGAEKRIGPDPAQYQKTVAASVAYLGKLQAADGSYDRQTGPAITALATTALLQNGRTPADPVVARGLKHVEKFMQPDGGIYQKDSPYMNYETCISILCLAAANTDGRYEKAIKRADAFVKGQQWDEAEGHDKSSPAYGGAGYGKHQRPDLSNTNFLIDALRAAGNGPDDEAIQKALIFVSRCQNLETEHNTTPHAAKNPDGGFYYTAAAGGSSQAGDTPGGGLRSYGSMTYAGLKSMIFAGVGPDDPRVKAAFKWAQKHYTVKQNPGLGDAGLYYYYHTFAKALDAMGMDLVEDAEGNQHDWRRELVEELASRQQADGSWINENSRWLEGDAALVTSYALLTLSHCKPKPAAE